MGETINYLSVPYHFDERGYLQPYAIIKIDSIEELEREFVSNFQLSSTRRYLFTGLLTYLNDFGVTLEKIRYEGEWRVWLNGSFTTQKVNPNDIDLLNLVTDSPVFYQNIELFRPLFGYNATRTYAVDSYFLLQNSSDETLKLLTYWKNQFGKDREGYPKGIVELSIVR